jgi:hypothetical protein
MSATDAGLAAPTVAGYAVRSIVRSSGNCRVRANDLPSKSNLKDRKTQMSIFGKIMGAIFGTKAEAGGSGNTAGGGSATTPGTSSTPAVDVAPILDKAVAAQKEKLAWRTSIVDLMKALNIDSSLAARKELAKELGYTGDMNDSASMNVWLHKQVMTKLAANGGKVPEDLKH